MFRIYITNLGKYTEGKLIGKWLDLPCQDINKELVSIGVKPNSLYEEAFISDWENNWNYEVGEYSNLKDLNKLAKKLQEIETEGNKKWLLAYCEASEEKLDEAIKDNKYQNSSFYEGEKAVDVLREQFDEELEILVKDKNLKQLIKWHFDYNEYAEEQLMDRYYETSQGTIYIC